MVAIKPNSSKPRDSSESSRFISKLAKFILVTVAFLVYLPLVPFFIVLVSPFYLYRFFVTLLAKLFRPDIIGIVSTRDGVVGLDDVTQKCECVLNLLFVYTGEPDINLIRDVFQKRVMDIKNPSGSGYSYEKFKYYYEFWLGFAFWKQEDDFRLEKHIRFCEQTESKASEQNNSTTEEDFLKILGPLSTQIFPPKMSPWEILIVKNYVPTPGKLHTDYVPNEVIIDENGNDGGKKWAILLRVHHGISDGYSLMKMVLNNWSNEPASRIPRAPIRKMNFLSTVLMYTGLIVLTPYYHFRTFVFDVDRNFWHLKPSKLTGEWYTTMTEKISFKKLKEIGVSHGVSTTAVLLGGFSGAIRKFLKESGQEHKIPEVMRGLAPMPWKNHPLDSLVNHWTLGTVVIPVGLDCPLNRLKAAEKSVRLLKTSPILFTNFGTVPLLLAPPSLLTDIWATNWMTTMIISNFPGPDFLVKSFDNYYTQECCFWLPQMRGSASMGVAFMSYNGGIRVTMTIDKAIIPDQVASVRLNDLISEEIKILHNLASSAATTV